MRRWSRIAIAAAVLATGLLVPAAGQARGGVAFSWSPSTSGAYAFGTLDAGAGQTKSVTFTLTNSGTMASGALTITLSASSAFTITADGCSGTSLGPKKMCSVSVKYAPTVNSASDTTTLTATGVRASATLALSGASGAPDLTLSPGTFAETDGSTRVYSLDFGTAVLLTQRIFVQNGGTGTSEPLLVLDGGGPGYSVTNDTCTNSALAPGGGFCSFDLAFNAYLAPPCPTGVYPLHDLVTVSGLPDGTQYILLETQGQCYDPLL